MTLPLPPSPLEPFFLLVSRCTSLPHLPWPAAFSCCPFPEERRLVTCWASRGPPKRFLTFWPQERISVPLARVGKGCGKQSRKDEQLPCQPACQAAGGWENIRGDWVASAPRSAMPSPQPDLAVYRERLWESLPCGCQGNATRSAPAWVFSFPTCQRGSLLNDSLCELSCNLPTELWFLEIHVVSIFFPDLSNAIPFLSHICLCTLWITWLTV